MDQRDKEVYFDIYCASCKHEKLKDHEDPCNDCLDHPTNTESHKPVRWEKGKSK